MRYTKKQLFIFLCLALTNLWRAACLSLLAPFFIKEAAKKGIEPGVYGFIVGIFDIAIFISAPLMGKIVPHIGEKFMYMHGTVVFGCCYIIYGFFYLFNNSLIFTIYAYIVRVIEGIAKAAITTVLYSTIAKEFPADKSTAFATLQVFFGVGLMTGPFIGGALYDRYGYGLPFWIYSFFIIGIGLLSAKIIPEEERRNGSNRTGNMLKLISKLPITITIFALFGVAFSIGFNQATLENHIRTNWKLTGFETGCIFSTTPAIYTVSSIFWGRVADKYVNPRKVLCIGIIFSLLCFVLIGPSPLIQLNPIIWLTVLSLALLGLGNGAQLSSIFAILHNEAVHQGFSDDLTTRGLISSAYVSTFGFGAFVGPTVGGWLLGLVEYRWVTLLPVFVLIVSLILNLIPIIIQARRNISNETKPLLDKDHE